MNTITPSIAPPRLRLRITLSDRCLHQDVLGFECRLRRYLRGSGVDLRIDDAAHHVLWQDTPIGPLERALLLSWIAEQPEVVLVHVAHNARGGIHGPI